MPGNTESEKETLHNAEHGNISGQQDKQTHGERMRDEQMRDEQMQGEQTQEARKNGYFRNLGAALHMELREHKSSFIVYFTLRLLVIVMMILQLLNRNYENVFLCILTLVLLVMPSIGQITFKVELPTTLEIIILVFIFAAEILGEIVLSGVSLLGYSAAYA